MSCKLRPVCVFGIVSSFLLLIYVKLDLQLIFVETSHEQPSSYPATARHQKSLVPFSPKRCVAGFVSSMEICRPCPRGQFSLPGWISCAPLLTCNDINYGVRIEGHFISGGVKHVYYADWNGIQVVYNIGYLKDDFEHGVTMLKALSPHPRIIHPIGECGNVLLTLRYNLGSAEWVNDVLARKEYVKFDNCVTRFRMALDYVTIIAYLHDSPIGVRVMCDSADLEKTLSQYLITDDLRLVLNDVDALPEVNHTEKKLIKCGHRELYGDFVAPEQKWPFADSPFNDDRMPPYDEKVDIWRVPAVVEFLLGNTVNSCSALTRLETIHTKCRNIDSKLRPSAKEVLSLYQTTWDILASDFQYE